VESEEEEEEENIYNYEGKDYSGKRRVERSEEDEAAVRRMVDEGGGAGPSGRGAVGKRRPRTEAGKVCAEGLDAFGSVIFLNTCIPTYLPISLYLPYWAPVYKADAVFTVL
jgi:hypothetical protein